MTYRKRSEILYRMIYVKAWTNHLGIKTQALRELRIQIAKLERLSAQNDFYFMQRIDSMKKVDKLQAQNAKRIGPQYGKVLSLVERVFQEVAEHKDKSSLTKASLRERLYGKGGFIREVEDYGRKHSVK
jgi:hypothetical protein